MIKTCIELSKSPLLKGSAQGKHLSPCSNWTSSPDEWYVRQVDVNKPLEGNHPYRSDSRFWTRVFGTGYHRTKEGSRNIVEDKARCMLMHRVLTFIIQTDFVIHTKRSSPPSSYLSMSHHAIIPTCPVLRRRQR